MSDESDELIIINLTCFSLFFSFDFLWSGQVDNAMSK